MGVTEQVYPAATHLQFADSIPDSFSSTFAGYCARIKPAGTDQDWRYEHTLGVHGTIAGLFPHSKDPETAYRWDCQWCEQHMDGSLGKWSDIEMHGTRVPEFLQAPTPQVSVVAAGVGGYVLRIDGPDEVAKYKIQSRPVAEDWQDEEHGDRWGEFELKPSRGIHRITEPYPPRLNTSPPIFYKIAKYPLIDLLVSAEADGMHYLLDSHPARIRVEIPHSGVIGPWRIFLDTKPINWRQT